MNLVDSIDIKKEHIEGGVREEASECAVALAIQDVICNKSDEWVEVCHDEIRICRTDPNSTSPREEFVFLAVDEKIGSWTRYFDYNEDEDNPPKPFKMLIDWRHISEFPEEHSKYHSQIKYYGKATMEEKPCS